jgi:hypothetical protein
MERRIVYQDADGVRRTLILDEENPFRVVIQTEQVLDEILAGVERDREFSQAGKDIKRVATIPVEIYERMIREGWGPDDEARWLNSAEAAPFRVWKGNVGRDR